MWDIPSIRQETNVTFLRPKDLLLTDINKLKTMEATKSYWKNILM